MVSGVFYFSEYASVTNVHLAVLDFGHFGVSQRKRQDVFVLFHIPLFHFYSVN